MIGSSIGARIRPMFACARWKRVMSATLPLALSLLQRNVQQFGCIAAEDGYPVGVAQALRPEDVIHGDRRPRKRMVRAKHDLADAAHGDEMP